jgi:hypothetical protein
METAMDLYPDARQEQARLHFENARTIEELHRTEHD